MERASITPLAHVGRNRKCGHGETSAGGRFEGAQFTKYESNISQHVFTEQTGAQWESGPRLVAFRLWKVRVVIVNGSEASWSRSQLRLNNATWDLATHFSVESKIRHQFRTRVLIRFSLSCQCYRPCWCFLFGWCLLAPSAVFSPKWGFSPMAVAESLLLALKGDLTLFRVLISYLPIFSYFWCN